MYAGRVDLFTTSLTLFASDYISTVNLLTNLYRGKGQRDEKIKVRNRYQKPDCIFCRAGSPDYFPDNRNDDAA
jgi:hypothetical protein